MTLKHLLTACAALLVAAQNINAGSTPTINDYKRLAETRTLVVLDDNIMSDFNLKIREVMKNEWNLTKYDFITIKEFNTKMGDPSYSFLLTTTVTYDVDKTKARYTYLSLLMGQEKTKVNDLPDLISVPLSYASNEDQDYAYKLSCFVRFIQKHVELMLLEPKLISATPLQQYSKSAKSLKGKTLLIKKEDLPKDLRTKEAFAKVYPNNFEFADETEITTAIDNQKYNYVFLHKVGPTIAKYNTRCFKLIMGTDDSEVYYFDYHMIDKKTPNVLLESDLKKMAKQ